MTITIYKNGSDKAEIFYKVLHFYRDDRKGEVKLLITQKGVTEMAVRKLNKGDKWVVIE